MRTLKTLAGVFGVLTLAGCSHREASPTPAPPPAAPPVAVTPAAPPVTASPALPRTKAVVYTVDNAHGKDANDYLVPHTIPLAASQDPARAAVLALLAAPDTPIPAGTRLKGIKTENGLATVDFSRSPVDETHGEEKQAQALEALQRTLGQFPEISRIQITVSGKAPVSIGESGGGPMDVLRPGEKPQETGGA